MTNELNTICGAAVQQRHGQTWTDIDDLTPATIREEIAAEILDDGVEECDEYLASNGQVYRWS